MGDQRLAPRVSAIEQAAQQTHLSQLTTLWESLQTELAQASVRELLEHFSSELEAGDYQQAAEVYTQLQTTYATRSRTEQKQQSQALLAREQPETASQQRSTLRQLLSQLQQTQQARRGVLIAGGSILAEETAPREFSAIIEESKQAEQEIASAQTSAVPVIETIPRPGKVAIVSVELTPEPRVGTASDVEVTIANAGTAPVSGVTVTLAAEAGVTVETAQSSVGSLAGGEERTATLGVTPTQSGEQTVTGTVTAAEAGSDTESVSLSVSTAGTSLERFDRDSDGQIEFDDLRFGLQEYNRGNISFEQLRRILRAYNTDQQV
jgi:Uncharacterized conserved protein